MSEVNINYWEDKLTSQELAHIDRLSGALDLPDRSAYASLSHFLADVTSKVSEAKSLSRQAAKVLGNK